MKLIIDSGATKTEYVLLKDKDIIQHFVNRGINANYLIDNEIKSIFEEYSLCINENLKKGITEIFYYGAGCGKAKNVERIAIILKTLFPESQIVVESDLLAACRALAEKQPAWIAVLGTGSSSCLYDGEKITNIAPSLGYLLGDEGSGTHIGKQLITNYLLDNLPTDIKLALEEEELINPALVLQKIYQEPCPNRFFAGFSKFIYQHSNHPYINQLCGDSFHQFIVQQKSYFRLKNSHQTLNIVGSVAFYFREIIKKELKRENLQIGKVAVAPMEGLILFHCNQ
jgi:N-acetylglucosamine kinase-like BadF-type ATPase